MRPVGLAGIDVAELPRVQQAVGVDPVLERLLPLVERVQRRRRQHRAMGIGDEAAQLGRQLAGPHQIGLVRHADGELERRTPREALEALYALKRLAAEG